MGRSAMMAMVILLAMANAQAATADLGSYCGSESTSKTFPLPSKDPCANTTAYSQLGSCSAFLQGKVTTPSADCCATAQKVWSKLPACFCKLTFFSVLRDPGPARAITRPLWCNINDDLCKICPSALQTFNLANRPDYSSCRTAMDLSFPAIVRDPCANSRAYSQLTSCLAFLQGNVTTPSAGCCASVKDIWSKLPACMCKLTFFSIFPDPGHARALKRPLLCNITDDLCSICPSTLQTIGFTSPDIIFHSKEIASATSIGAVLFLIGCILLVYCRKKVFCRHYELKEYARLCIDMKKMEGNPTVFLDYYRLALDSIESVQNIVNGASETTLQLNEGQCKILAQELAKVRGYLLVESDKSMACQKEKVALLHLYHAIRKSKLLVENCCLGTSESWLVAAMTLVEIQEDFAAIILDLHQWRLVLEYTITSTTGASRQKQEELLTIMDEKCQDLYKNLRRNDHDLQKAALEDKRILVLKLAEVQAGSKNGLEYLRAIHLQSWLTQFEDDTQLVDLNVQEKLTKFEDPQVLGRGGCGTVLRVTWLGVLCALKMLSVKDETEATALKGLLHPNIIRLYHYWEAPTDNPKSHLLMELMAMDLTAYIESRLKDMACSSTHQTGESEDTMPFSLPVAIDIMLQVAQALQYLHDKHLTHRDLKTSNILVRGLSKEFTNFSAEGYVDIKIADFGLAKAYDNTSTGHMHTVNTGTPLYGAPEIFGKDLASERNFPPKADVWSFGVTCAEILSGKKPYANEPRNTLHTRISKENLRPTLPKFCPQYLAFCISSCWEFQPQMRPDFASICKMLRHAKLLSLNLTNLDDTRLFLAYRTRSGFEKGFSVSSLIGRNAINNTC